MLGLVVLAAFLLLAVKRLNEVLGQYRAIVFSIRADGLGRRSPQASRDMEPAWADLPGPSKSYMRSTSGAAELVLYAALAFFEGALIAGAVRAAQVVGSTTAWACMVAAALGSTACVVCLSLAGRPGAGPS